MPGRRARRSCASYDAVYFGAVGNPAIVPDHISAWGLLINFRRWFDLYVNLRPVRLFEGLPCPLAGRKPGDIDYFVVRENTEGEYGNVGGRMFEGTPHEVVMQQSMFSRKGVDRIMKYSFELAKTRKKHVTSLHQVERHHHHHAVLGRALRRDEEAVSRRENRPVPRRRPDHPAGAEPRPLRRHRRLQPVRRHPLRPRAGDRRHHRHRASGNINPERTAPSIFEPVHGSAPDIAGKKIANPIGQIWSGALMLEHLGHAEAAADIVRAIERVIVEGPHTPDMKGKACTPEVGAAVADAVRSQSKIAA